MFSSSPPCFYMHPTFSHSRLLHPDYIHSLLSRSELIINSLGAERKATPF